MTAPITAVGSAFGTAGSGLKDAERRLDASARQIASLGSPARDSVDLGEAALNLIQSRVAFEASAAAIAVVDRMVRTVVDLRV